MLKRRSPFTLLAVFDCSQQPQDGPINNKIPEKTKNVFIQNPAPSNNKKKNLNAYGQCANIFKRIFFLFYQRNFLVKSGKFYQIYMAPNSAYKVQYNTNN